MYTPANNILVNIEQPAAMRSTKKSKKNAELAEAAGEIYTAKVFAVDENSTDYVELNWTEGNTPQVIGYHGLADTQKSYDLFITTTNENIARNIE